MRTTMPSPPEAVGLLVTASMYSAGVGEEVGAPDLCASEPDIQEDPALQQDGV